MASQHGYVEQLAQRSEDGQPFVSVTLVDAIGSTPQDAGSKMLVDETGRVFGTVGGGRIEHRAIDFAKEMLSSNSKTARTFVEWNLQRDIGMTCGGVVKLFFEAYNLVTWQIALFGAGHVAQSLVRILLELECQLTCIDSRAEWLGRLPDSPKLQKLKLDNPETHVGSLSDDSSVLCMTMGHATDRPILEECFRRGCEFPYLGVIGSKAKRKVLVRELLEAGIDHQLASSFRCPIGLPLGSNQVGEIAVSIAAELIEVHEQNITSSSISKGTES